MSFRSIFLATVALAVAAPLAAQQPEPTPTQAAAVPAPKKPRPICRQLGDTGSHFVKRVCHTAEEWAAIDAASAGGPQRSGTDGARR